MKTVKKMISFLFIFLLFNLCANNIKRNALKKNTFLKTNYRLLDESDTAFEGDSESESEEGEGEGESESQSESESESESIEAGSTENSTFYNNSNSNSTILPQSSSSGLSTGAICAIAIPCIAGLLGVAAAAALCKGGAISTPALHPQLFLHQIL